MKKVFQLLLAFIVLIVLIVGAGAAWINFSGIPKYETVKFDYQVAVTPEKVERGRKLASMLCVFCHTNHSTGLLTGQRMPDAPREFGKIYSQNITQDKTHGIGNWTDAELLYLLRTGIKRDGQYSPPYMPKLAHMADEDIESVIAFLRSDDRLVAPAGVPDTACQPSFLTKFLCR
ncbi:MAG TPA: cytochrome c, partial [Chitinophagales bacterium]|nr:cytochrome c [Chitinophagales bacterium]